MKWRITDRLYRCMYVLAIYIVKERGERRGEEEDEVMRMRMR